MANKEKHTRIEDDELTDLLNSLPLPLKVDKRTFKNTLSILELAQIHESNQLTSNHKEPLDLLIIAIDFLKQILKNPEYVNTEPNENRAQQRYRIAETLKSLGYDRAFAQVLTNRLESFHFQELSREKSKRVAELSEIEYQQEIINYQARTLRKIISSSSKEKYWRPTSIKNIPNVKYFISDELPIDYMQVAVDAFIALDTKLNFLDILDEEDFVEARVRIVRIFFMAGFHRIAFQILLNKEHINDADYVNLDTDKKIIKIAKNTEQQLTEKYQKKIKSRSRKENFQQIMKMFGVALKKFFSPVNQSQSTIDPP